MTIEDDAVTRKRLEIDWQIARTELRVAAVVAISAMAIGAVAAVDGSPEFGVSITAVAFVWASLFLWGRRRGAK